MAIDDLLSDLDSDGDEQVEQVKQVEEEDVELESPPADVQFSSTIEAKIEPILQQIEHFSSQRIDRSKEHDFLISANEISVDVSAEQQELHTLVKNQYAKRFPELQYLIPQPLDYAKVVMTLGNSLDIDAEELSFLGKERILVLTMSALQARESSIPLTQDELETVVQRCQLLLKLEDLKVKIQQYVSSRLVVFLPNVTAIVGARTAAQFMGLVGGINDLAKTPACNVAGLGNRRTISKSVSQHGVQQQGFLYHSDLIQSVPPALMKQAMRITSGKLVLAARIDLSESIPDGSQGRKWKQEILEKIAKLEEPPEIVATKALPVPVDRKAKKRGGKRYRKLKQKFEQSDLRKAQDRVVFGQREKTVTDAFGEEVGLGMLSSLSRIPQNVNNKAKMSKGMKNRLQNSNGTVNPDNFFNQDFINLPRESDESAKKRVKR